MNEVYVVRAGWHYECSDIIGVFYKKEDAVALKEETVREGRYDFVEITLWEVK